MLRIKNTIACPACGGLLRVRVNVVSDGNEYEYYLCPACQDVARHEPDGGGWSLRGEASPAVPDLVRSLQALAVEDWRAASTSREPPPVRMPGIVGRQRAR